MSRHEILELEKELKTIDGELDMQSQEHLVTDSDGKIKNIDPEFMEL